MWESEDDRDTKASLTGGNVHQKHDNRADSSKKALGTLHSAEEEPLNPFFREETRSF